MLLQFRSARQGDAPQDAAPSRFQSFDEAIDHAGRVLDLNRTWSHVVAWDGDVRLFTRNRAGLTFVHRRQPGDDLQRRRLG